MDNMMAVKFGAVKPGHKMLMVWHGPFDHTVKQVLDDSAPTNKIEFEMNSNK